MKKQLPLYILLIFLVAFNGFFLVKYLGDSNDNDSRRPAGPGHFISERLNFSEVQNEQFNNLEVTHRQRMTSILEEIRTSKDALFDQISKANVDAAVVDSITTVIGNYEKKKDMEVFQHFRNIYDICDDHQKREFEKLVKEALHKGPPPRGRRPPHGKDKHGPQLHNH